MTKNHIHIVTITRNGEKHLFQLQLPLNTVRINSIQTSVNPQYRFDEIQLDTFPVEAGWLWLEIPFENGLLPYYEEVRADIPVYDQTIISLTPLDDIDIGKFWHQGRKKVAFDLNVYPTERTIQGYYVDQIGKGHGKSYEVKIYLNLEIDETL